MKPVPKPKLEGLQPAVLESPFRGHDGDYTTGLVYTNACIKDMLHRGETAAVSHKVFPGALDDGKPQERSLGIQAGLDMANYLAGQGFTVAFYIDFGMSPGMVAARDQYPPTTHIEYRTLPRETIAELRRKL